MHDSCTSHALIAPASWIFCAFASLAKAPPPSTTQSHTLVPAPSPFTSSISFHASSIYIAFRPEADFDATYNRIAGQSRIDLIDCTRLRHTARGALARTRSKLRRISNRIANRYILSQWPHVPCPRGGTLCWRRRNHQHVSRIPTRPLPASWRTLTSSASQTRSSWSEDVWAKPNSR